MRFPRLFCLLKKHARVHGQGQMILEDRFLGKWSFAPHPKYCHSAFTTRQRCRQLADHVYLGHKVLRLQTAMPVSQDYLHQIPPPPPPPHGDSSRPTLVGSGCAPGAVGRQHHGRLAGGGVGGWVPFEKVGCLLQPGPPLG